MLFGRNYTQTAPVFQTAFQLIMKTHSAPRFLKATAAKLKEIFV